MVPQVPSTGNVPAAQTEPLASARCRGDAVRGLGRHVAWLFEQGEPDWAQRPGFTLVKQSTVRAVWRTQLPDGTDVHVKLFRALRLADRVRDRILGPGAAREYDNLLRAHGLGLPAAEPLAVGFLTDAADGRSFLVTRTVQGARPFDWSVPAAVARAAGALVRRVHDLGLAPADLHHGNLLVDDAGRPWLIDLTSVRNAGTPSHASRAHGLETFCKDLDGGSLDPHAAAFAAGYFDGHPEPAPAALHGKRVQCAQRLRLRGLASFGKRSERNCRHTKVNDPRRSEAFWATHVGSDPVLDARLVESCCVFASAPPQPLRAGRRGATWLLDELVVKQRDAARARDLFRAAYWLHFAGVPQAAPVALRTFRGTGHVFTRRIPNRDLAAELREGALAPARIHAVARALGTSIGRLHAHGLRNRDLKLENLVRDPHTDIVHMVDHEGVQRRRPDDTRRQGADLGRLLAGFRVVGAPGGEHVARTFLRAYIRARNALHSPPALRRILRTAGERAQQWAASHETGNNA